MRDLIYSILQMKGEQYFSYDNCYFVFFFDDDNQKVHYLNVYFYLLQCENCGFIVSKMFLRRCWLLFMVFRPEMNAEHANIRNSRILLSEMSKVEIWNESKMNTDIWRARHYFSTANSVKFWNNYNMRRIGKFPWK